MRVLLLLFQSGFLLFLFLLWLLWLILPKLGWIVVVRVGRHPCLITDFRGDAFSFSSLWIMFAMGLSYMVFIMLKYVPSMPAFWRVFFFIINGCWIFSKAFLSSYFFSMYLLIQQKLELTTSITPLSFVFWGKQNFYFSFYMKKISKRLVS